MIIAQRRLLCAFALAIGISGFVPASAQKRPMPPIGPSHTPQDPGPCVPTAATPSTAAVALPDLSGTYTADDGGIYYIQRSGNTLWWAGLSVDPKVPLEQQWHRGLDFTHVFNGTVFCDGQIIGNWVDVPRGTTLASGTLTLAVGLVGGATQFIQTASTGGFTARLWRRRNAIDDDAAGNTPMDLYARFHAVNKNSNETLYDNLKPYRDATVVFGRVYTTQPSFIDDGDMEPPHVNLGEDYSPEVSYFPNFGRSDRDLKGFCKAADTHSHDGDFDMRLKIDLSKMEKDFFTTGWGSQSNGPTVFRQKFTYAAKDPSYSATEAYLGVEAIMYGRWGTCALPGYFGPALLPGWADSDSNSMLVNGRPVNGSLYEAVNSDSGCDFVQPCPAPDFAHPLDSGIRLGNLLITAKDTGAFVRITGPLVLDCGHGATSPCYDELDDMDGMGENQNQEIHPIYSIDIINAPFRPGDANMAARTNLTGVWAGDDGSTYYIRQIGSTVWWLGQMRDRQPMQPGADFPIIGAKQLASIFSAANTPCGAVPAAQCWAFATVFEGALTETPGGGQIIQGAWAGVPQSVSAGTPGGPISFVVDPMHKMITPQTGVTIFPVLTKIYEPEDTTPPKSAMTTVSVQPSGVQGPHHVSGAILDERTRQVTINATDQGGSGVQNIWYRSYSGSQKPAYTFVAGSTASFTLTGTMGSSYDVDFYATDNAGNDETPQHVIIAFATVQH